MSENVSLDQYLDDRIRHLDAEIERLKGAVAELRNLRALAKVNTKVEEATEPTTGVAP